MRGVKSSFSDSLSLRKSQSNRRLTTLCLVEWVKCICMHLSNLVVLVLSSYWENFSTYEKVMFMYCNCLFPAMASLNIQCYLSVLYYCHCGSTEPEELGACCFGVLEVCQISIIKTTLCIKSRSVSISVLISPSTKICWWKLCWAFSFSGCPVWFLCIILKLSELIFLLCLVNPCTIPF